jgi:hypothetical protein
MWYIDTTIIRLLDGTRAYVHAVIDIFSRRILAWRVVQTFAAVNSVSVLLEAIEGATRSASAPVVVADAGVENVNTQVDALIDTGSLRRLLAFTELKFLELDDRSVMAFYVHEHNRVLPHSAFRGPTPDDVLPHRRRGGGGPDGTRGRRAPSTRSVQPIGVLYDVPVTQRGRMTFGCSPLLRPQASHTRATQDDCENRTACESHEQGAAQCPDSDRCSSPLSTMPPVPEVIAGCGRE